MYFCSALTLGACDADRGLQKCRSVRSIRDLFSEGKEQPMNREGPKGPAAAAPRTAALDARTVPKR